MLYDRAQGGEPPETAGSPVLKAAASNPARLRKV
jgi:hypothetical protein